MFSAVSRKRKVDGKGGSQQNGRKRLRPGTIEDERRVKGGDAFHREEGADLVSLLREAEMSGALQGVDDGGDCIG
jgi:hypothetical protein